MSTCRFSPPRAVISERQLCHLHRRPESLPCPSILEGSAATGLQCQGNRGDQLHEDQGLHYPSPSFSTDDVYNLLNAINGVTLKRMEDENANWFKTVIDYLKYFNVTVLPRMEQEILAIKTKVGLEPSTEVSDT